MTYPVQMFHPGIDALPEEGNWWVNTASALSISNENRWSSIMVPTASTSSMRTAVTLRAIVHHQTSSYSGRSQSISILEEYDRIAPRVAIFKSWFPVFFILSGLGSARRTRTVQFLEYECRVS